MKASPWKTYAICPGCVARYYAPFGSVFHLPFDVCPHCGEQKCDWRGSISSGGAVWPVKTMRYVSTSKLFNPSTWGTGHWEERVA